MEMDDVVSTIATPNELNDQRGTASHESIVSALNKACAIFDSKHVLRLPPSSSSAFLELVQNGACGTSLGPVTPDSNRESVDFHFESTSPLSLSSSPPPKAFLCFNSHHKDDYLYSFREDNPCTPRKDVFDPFAPGPDNLLLAPYCRKSVEEARISVARQLKFESSSKFSTSNDSETHDKEAISEEESLFQALYMTILEAIISVQAKDIAKVSDVLPNSDGFKTPPFAPHLNEVADTCPRAPVKPTKKFRSIDKDICRRLDF